MLGGHIVRLHQKHKRLHLALAAEAAGLRVPQLGRNQAQQPHWAAYNLLFHSALPAFDGEHASTKELPSKVMDRHRN